MFLRELEGAFVLKYQLYYLTEGLLKVTGSPCTAKVVISPKQLFVTTVH